jgi:chemotaxis protein histidine kinase CheA
MSDRNDMLSPRERARAVAAVRRSAGVHLAGLAGEVAQLDEVAEAPDSQVLQRIVVHAHTLGGAARVTGLEDVASLAESIETLVCDPVPADGTNLRGLKLLVAELSARIGRTTMSSEPISPARVERSRLAMPAATSVAY